MGDMSDAIISRDLNGVVIGWNPAAAALFGYAAADILGLSGACLLPPEQQQEDGLRLHRLVQGEIVAPVMTVRLHRDGRRLPLMLTCAPVNDAFNTVIAVTEVLRAAPLAGSTTAAALDTRLPPLAYPDLPTSLTAVLEALPSGALLSDQQGLIVAINSVAEQIFGYSCDELLGQSVEYLVPTALRDSHQALRESYQTTSGSRLMGGGRDFIVQRKNGEQLPVQIGLTTLHTRTGSFVLATLIDVAERRSIEIALRESEERFRALVDASAQIVWTADATGAIVEDSPSWRAFTGQTYEEGRGLGWLAALHPDDRQRVAALWQRLVALHRPFNSEYRLRHISGEWRWMAVRVVPLLAADGSVRSWVGMNTDISERKRVEELIASQNQVLERIAGGAPLAAVLHDIAHLIEVQMNGSLCSILLLDADGIHLHTGAAPSLPPAYVAAIDGVAIGPTVGSCGTAAYRGKTVIVSDIAQDPLWDNYRELALAHDLRACWSKPILDRNQRVLGSFALYYRQPAQPDARQLRLLDIAAHLAAIGIDRHRADSERTRAEQTLFAEKERALVTLESIGDGVITTDAAGHIEYLNPVAEALTGWPTTEARGQPMETVFPLIDEHTRAELANPVARCLAEQRVTALGGDTTLLSRDGREHAIEDSVAPIRDRSGQILGAVLVFHDVSEQRRLTREIAHQAAHDALTGLVNRREFERRLRQVLDNAQTEHSEHALCYFDLDQFKIINDTCGHEAGDELLRQLVQVFQAHIRTCDTLGRLGGDEFGVLLEYCPPPQAQHIAQALRLAVEAFRFFWEERRFQISISIGLVAINAASHSLAAILQAADSACYVAKDSGRNRIHVYREHDAQLTRRSGELQWVARLQQAMEDNRFQLYAQPIAPLTPTTATGTHCELLLRLLEEDGRLALPGAFIPAAERYHLAPRLDRWVVNHAFNWLAERPEHLSRLTLCAINLSGQSLSDRTFQTYVLEQLNAYALPTDKICFEITETAAIANLADAIHFIKVLKSYGCYFALDDFGSGLSSFAYLKRLPVDFLKIDGLFVKDIVHDPLDLAMVRSINEIGQLMGKRTIAEFAETQAILEQLSQLGVNYAQGHAIGYPQPLEDLLAPLASV